MSYSDYESIKQLQAIAEAAGYERGLADGKVEAQVAHVQRTNELVADHVKACVQIKRLIEATEALAEGGAADVERLINAIENAKAFLRGDL